MDYVKFTDDERFAKFLRGTVIKERLATFGLTTVSVSLVFAAFSFFPANVAVSVLIFVAGTAATIAAAAMYLLGLPIDEVAEKDPDQSESHEKPETEEDRLAAIYETGYLPMVKCQRQSFSQSRRQI